jgi:hypothetical protein
MLKFVLLNLQVLLPKLFMIDYLFLVSFVVKIK